MTDGRRRRPSWDDEDLDRLLRDFFALEMPAEFRSPAAEASASSAWRSARTTAPAESVVPGRWRHRAPHGLAAAALVLLAAASTVLFPGTRRAAPEGEEITDNVPRVEEGSPDSGEPDPLVPIVVEVFPPDEQSPVFVVHERRETADGPVELRIEKRTEKVEYVDPATGAAVEMEFPEFEIEVYPIEER